MACINGLLPGYASGRVVVAAGGRPASLGKKQPCDDSSKPFACLGWRAADSQARLVPVLAGRRLLGYEIFAINPGSVYELTGLENGDVILALNATQVKDPESALQAFRTLREEARVRIAVDRGGPMVINHNRPDE